jgi:hypothetical protein
VTIQKSATGDTHVALAIGPIEVVTIGPAPIAIAAIQEAVPGRRSRRLTLGSSVRRPDC